jgi:hypothetical protein
LCTAVVCDEDDEDELLECETLDDEWEDEVDDVLEGTCVEVAGVTEPPPPEPEYDEPE